MGVRPPPLDPRLRLVLYERLILTVRLLICACFNLLSFWFGNLRNALNMSHRSVAYIGLSCEIVQLTKVFLDSNKILFYYFFLAEF